MSLPVPAHAETVSAIAETLGTSAEEGLGRSEAAKRLAQGGNRMPEPKVEGFLVRLFKQLTSPIAFVLVLAALATAALGHLTDALVIGAALAVNVAMGLVQEGRASRAFDALRAGEAKTAMVIRAGAPARIPAEELVPGDLVALALGDAVPADIRLVEAHGLSVNEASLSGEWLAVEKGTAPVAADAPLVERACMAYAGTLVAAGAGTGIVVATGAATEIGRIAAALGQPDRVETPLSRDIKQVARLILVIVSVVVLLIAILGTLRGLQLEDTLLTAIALAVASVPEGLPAAVTVVLALGMERILRSGGLVRSLLAAETLGTTSIVLTDKTGTLTQGVMALGRLVTASGTVATANAKGDGEAYALLRAAVLAASARVERGPEGPAVHGRPVEAAVVRAGLEQGLDPDALGKEQHRLDELHFDSARRYGGALVEADGVRTAYLSGAPELFLESLGRIADGDRAQPLEAPVKARFETALARAAAAGARVVATARVRTELAAFPEEAGLPAFLAQGELLGLLLLDDPVRPEAAQAIADMRAAGLQVLMLTGDNPVTALSIAREVGIASPDARATTGAKLAKLDDAQLLHALREGTVFARVAPADKLRIANALTGAGEVIAMTGDGVNDAPALRAASIGIALGSGTDVAKEASDLVLLRNGFSVITVAIREGRRLRENFRKIFAYMLATNASEVTLIASALAFGLPLPILPTQLLWANLVEGGLMNFAYAFEPLYPDAMKRSPKDPETARVLSPRLLRLIGVVGAVTSATLVCVYLFLTFATDLPLERVQTLMFIAVSVNCVFMAFSLKSFGIPLWKLSPLSNRFLLLSLVGSFALLLAALYLPALQTILHTTPPTPLEVLALAGFGLLNLLTIEFAKWFVFMRPARSAAGSAILGA